ncbi:hypothetical protein DFP72DRAFT_64029 [Ephemerocybe angulata]|uniref:SPX domain-containing protein n=1 Tax=Ephemerocybe angulata TaxID=980116 RepID=A0A8H6LXE5_9AGAR|nr:hypothetical protein DFP72DRAFT_64029 [Tulosesus angulatus]
MKFAQYLRDTQTPEWKKAYIDYRGLKKRITAIRKAEQGLDFTASPDDSPAHPATPAATPRTSSITLPLDTIDNPRESSSKPRQRRNTVTSIARQAFSSAVPDDVRKSPAMGGRAGSYHPPSSEPIRPIWRWRWETH